MDVAVETNVQFVKATCRICLSQDRAKIEDDLTTMSFRAVSAKWPKCSISSLHRHKAGHMGLTPRELLTATTKPVKEVVHRPARPEIRVTLAEGLTSEGAPSYAISQAELLGELALIAQSDLAHFYSWEQDGRPRLKTPQELGPLTRCIQAMSFYPDGGLRNIKLHPKDGLLRLLATHSGLVSERHVGTILLKVLDPQTGMATTINLPPIAGPAVE